MKDTTELLAEITAAEKHLQNLRERLEKSKYPSPEEAKPGDVLEDGSIVGYRWEDTSNSIGGIMVVAPPDMRFKVKETFYNDALRNYFGRGWFIPSPNQLLLCSRKDIFKTGDIIATNDDGHFMRFEEDEAYIINVNVSLFELKLNDPIGITLVPFRIITFNFYRNNKK
jgi:hypothetical protein